MSKRTPRKPAKTLPEVGVRHYDGVTGKTVSPPPDRERGTDHTKGHPPPPPPRPPESPGWSSPERDYLGKPKRRWPIWIIDLLLRRRER